MQGVQFGRKTDCESEAKANFFSKRKAKAKRSERPVPKSEATSLRFRFFRRKAKKANFLNSIFYHKYAYFCALFEFAFVSEICLIINDNTILIISYF